MKTYRVYISQVNQQYYDVKANGKTSAMAKAEKLWKQENGPSVCAVEEQEAK